MYILNGIVRLVVRKGEGRGGSRGPKIIEKTKWGTSPLASELSEIITNKPSNHIAIVDRKKKKKQNKTNTNTHTHTKILFADSSC